MLQSQLTRNNQNRSVSAVVMTIFFIFFLFAFAPTHVTVWAKPVKPATACASTLYPSYCKSILPRQDRNLSEYACITVSKSLSATTASIDTISDFLSRNSYSMSRAALEAVEVCRYLFGLSADYVTTCNNTLSTAINPTMNHHDNVRTYLSSVITNQRTCLDGLRVVNDDSINNDLRNPISAATTKLYSVTLSLFAQASGTITSKSNPNPNPSSRRSLLFHELAIDDRDEWQSGRRLLQAPSSVLISKKVVVSKDGTGNFTKINDAISSAPNNTDGSKGYFLIYVKAGVYKEYVSIASKTKYVMMVGDGINRTVITGSRNVVDGSTTFNSATFAVVGQGFVAINMTFQNTAGAIKHQAVAVRNGADLSTFHRCSFDGYQDTLYAHSMRQFYSYCTVYGTVDFIFGNAAVLLQSCTINPRLPTRGQSDTITAQGRTDPSQNTGTVIQNCNIKPTPDLAAANFTVRTYLGRPWKEYSRTVVMQSALDGFVDPAGWMPWNGSFALNTLYYAEYNNTGAGAGTSGRVTWPGYHVINRTTAAGYTVSNFLSGDFWLPQTGVGYVGGLF